MAERNVGAKDLGGSGVITGSKTAPGAITGKQLAPGAMGAQQILGTATVPLAQIPGAIPPTDVMQRILKDTGFYNGMIDGKFGPKTKAALAAWEAAGRPMTRAEADAARAGQAAAAGAGGGVGGDLGGDLFGGLTPAPAPAPVSYSAPLTPTPPFSSDPAERFPEMAALMSVPAIRDILTRATRESWSSEKMAMEVRATDWWRSTSPTKRAFIALEARDPAAAAQQVAAKRDEIKQFASDYYISMSDETLDAYARKVAGGDLDPAAFKNEVVSLAKGKFPPLTGSLDQGLTVRQIADPYIRQAAQELEINPADIDLNDPKWSRALMGFDENGKPRAMTLYEWQRTLRTDDTYGYDRTSNARKQAAQLTTSIAQTFGRIGS